MRWRLLLPCLLLGVCAAPSFEPSPAPFPDTTLTTLSEEIKPLTPVSVTQLDKTLPIKSSKEKVALNASTTQRTISKVQPPRGKKVVPGVKIVSSKQRASQNMPAKQLGSRKRKVVSSKKNVSSIQQVVSTTAQPIRKDTFQGQLQTTKGIKEQEGYSKDGLAMVNTSSPLHVVSDRFLSLSLDPNMIADLPWADPSTVRLARLLSPAWFKVCPSVSNQSAGFNLSMYQWAAVNHFTSEAGLAQMWDAAMFALAARDWLKSGGLGGHNATQLEVPAVHEFPPSPQKVGFSVKSSGLDDLRAINSIFSRYSSAAVTVAGPDIKFFSDYKDMVAFAKWLNASANNISVVSWNPSALIGRYLSTEHSDLLRLEQSVVRGVLEQTGHSDKTLWVGDMSLRWEDNADTGATFGSAMLWLDRLGAMAASGVSVAFQPALLPLHKRGVPATPSTEYWTAVLHKRLAGPRVLHVRSRCEGDAPCRLYAHCTPSGENSHYLAGAVTVIGVNMKGSELRGNVSGWPGEQAESVHQYILTGKLEDKDIYLNGKKLRINPDTQELPTIRPNIISAPGELIMPPYSMVFWVFPGIGAKACLHEENGRGKRLSPSNAEEGLTTHLALLFPVNEILGGEDDFIKSKQKRCHHDLHIPAIPPIKRRISPELLIQTKVPVGQCPPGCRPIEKSPCDFHAMKIMAPGCSTTEILQRLLDMAKKKRKGNCYCDQLDGTTASYDGQRGEYPNQRLNLLQAERKVNLYPGHLPSVDGTSELPIEMTSYDIPGETTEYAVQVPTGIHFGDEYEAPERYAVLHHQGKPSQYSVLHHQTVTTGYNRNRYTETNEETTEYAPSHRNIEDYRPGSENDNLHKYKIKEQPKYSNLPLNEYDSNVKEYNNNNYQQKYDETTNRYKISSKYDKGYEKYSDENLVDDYKQIINYNLRGNNKPEARSDDYKAHGERRTTRSSVPYGTHFTARPMPYDTRDDGSSYQQRGHLYSTVMTSSERYPPQHIQQLQPREDAQTVLQKPNIQNLNYVTETNMLKPDSKQGYHSLNIPHEGYQIPVFIKYETQTKGVGHGIIHFMSPKDSTEHKLVPHYDAGPSKSIYTTEVYGNSGSDYDGSVTRLKFDETTGRYTEDVNKNNHNSGNFKEEITTLKYPVASRPQYFESNKRIHSDTNKNHERLDKKYYNSITKEINDKKNEQATENIIASHNEKLYDEYKPRKYYEANTEENLHHQKEYVKSRDSNYRINQQNLEQREMYNNKPTEKCIMYETTLSKYQPNIRGHDRINLQYAELTERNNRPTTSPQESEYYTEADYVKEKYDNYAPKNPSYPKYRSDDSNYSDPKYGNKHNYIGGDEKYRSEQQLNDYGSQSNQEAGPSNLEKHRNQNLIDKYDTNSKYAENYKLYQPQEDSKYIQTGKYNSNPHIYAPYMYATKNYDSDGRGIYSHTLKSQYTPENEQLQTSAVYSEQYGHDKYYPDNKVVKDCDNEIHTQNKQNHNHNHKNAVSENTYPQYEPAKTAQSHSTEYTGKTMQHERNGYSIESQIKPTFSDYDSAYKSSNNIPSQKNHQPLKTNSDTEYDTQTPPQYARPSNKYVPNENTYDVNKDQQSSQKYEYETVTAFSNYRDSIKGRQQSYESNTMPANSNYNKPATPEIPENCLPYILRYENKEMTSNQYDSLTKNQVTENYELSSNVKQNYNPVITSFDKTREQNTINYAPNYKYDDEKKTRTKENRKYGSNEYDEVNRRVLADNRDYGTQHRESEYNKQRPQEHQEHQYQPTVSTHPAEQQELQYVQNNSIPNHAPSSYATENLQYKQDQVMQDRLLHLNKNIFPETQPFDQYQKYNPLQRQIYSSQKFEYPRLHIKQAAYENPYEYQIPTPFLQNSQQILQNQRYDNIYDHVPYRHVAGFEPRPYNNKLYTRPSGPSLSGLLGAALGKFSERRPYQQPLYHQTHDNRQLGYGYQQYEDKPRYQPHVDHAYENVNIIGRHANPAAFNYRSIHDQPSYDNNMAYGFRMDKTKEDTAREAPVENYKLASDKGEYKDKYVQDKSINLESREIYSTPAPSQYKETIDQRQPEYKPNQRSEEVYPQQILYKPQKPQNEYAQVPILSEECAVRCAGSKICDQNRFYRFVASLLKQYSDSRDATNVQKLLSDEYLTSNNGYSDNNVEQGFVKSERLFAGLRGVLTSNRDEENKMKVGSVYVECPTECSFNPCIDHFGRKIKIIMSVISWLKDCLIN